MIKYIDELQKEELSGKKVLLRLDLNSPLKDGQFTDTSRLERAIETIDYLRDKDAQVIVISHLENKDEGNESLLPVQHFLNGYFPVEFSPTYFTPEAIEKLLQMKDKSVLLFENIRNNPGEIANDPEFAKKLAQMAEIYVNDAFSVSHRKHASIVGVPKFLPHYAGFVMKSEIENLSKAFNPVRPFVFILGGAKFNTKIPLLKKYIETADKVFVGGALANNIFKEKGFEIGKSLVTEGEFGLEDIIENPKLNVSVDVTVTENENVLFKNSNEVTRENYIEDAGPKTVDQLKNLLADAKTLVWNGPLGNYEEGFKDKTESLAEIVADLTSKGSLNSIVGGGDTLASINELNIKDKFSFISTGGGAMLDFLADETLSGIDALK